MSLDVISQTELFCLLLGIEYYSIIGWLGMILNLGKNKSEPSPSRGTSPHRLLSLFRSIYTELRSIRITGLNPTQTRVGWNWPRRLSSLEEFREFVFCCPFSRLYAGNNNNSPHLATEV